MTALVWDKTGERFFETGVDHGVLYQVDEAGEYVDGVAWNGLTAVNESPSGAESTPQYADNIKYLNLISAEEFGATIEALTYPVEFEQNDGSASPAPGVMIGQQNRKAFGFCYRTRIGNDLNPELGYKLHLVYGCLASPSEKAHATVNESPEAVAFSWELTTTPVNVGTIGGITYKPTAKLTVDSRNTDPAKLATLEEQLYGTVISDPSMPLPADVIAMLGSTLTLATPVAPTYDSSDDMITIPAVTGVEYWINGALVPAGDFGPITTNTLVKVRAATGYRLPVPHQSDYLITFA